MAYRSVVSESLTGVALPLTTMDSARSAVVVESGSCVAFSTRIRIRADAPRRDMWTRVRPNSASAHRSPHVEVNRDSEETGVPNPWGPPVAEQ